MHSFNSNYVVDAGLGSAYAVVRHVYNNMTMLIQLSDQMEEIAQYTEQFYVLVENIDELLLIAKEMDAILIAANNMPFILIISSNMPTIQYVADNMEELLQLAEDTERLLVAAKAIETQQYKQSVYAASRTPVAPSGRLSVVDGLTPPMGSRVLLLGQTNPAENGVYITSDVAWQRSSDFNSPENITNNSLIMVDNGAINKGLCFRLNCINPVSIGGTPLVFLEYIVTTTAIPAGVGLSLIKQGVGPAIHLKTLAAGAGILLSETTDEVIITGGGGGGGGGGILIEGADDSGAVPPPFAVSALQFATKDFVVEGSGVDSAELALDVKSTGRVGRLYEVLREPLDPDAGIIYEDFADDDFAVYFQGDWEIATVSTPEGRWLRTPIPTEDDVPYEYYSTAELEITMEHNSIEMVFAYVNHEDVAGIGYLSVGVYGNAYSVTRQVQLDSRSPTSLVVFEDIPSGIYNIELRNHYPTPYAYMGLYSIMVAPKNTLANEVARTSETVGRIPELYLDRETYADPTPYSYAVRQATSLTPPEYNPRVSFAGYGNSPGLRSGLSYYAPMANQNYGPYFLVDYPTRLGAYTFYNTVVHNGHAQTVPEKFIIRDAGEVYLFPLYIPAYTSIQFISVGCLSALQLERLEFRLLLASPETGLPQFSINRLSGQLSAVMGIGFKNTEAFPTNSIAAGLYWLMLDSTKELPLECVSSAVGYHFSGGNVLRYTTPPPVGYTSAPPTGIENSPAIPLITVEGTYAA